MQPLKPALDVQPSKKQKGKKIVKEVIRVGIEDNTASEVRPEDNVLARTFLYPEFMDKALVTPAVLEQIAADDEGVVSRMQWMGRNWSYCFITKNGFGGVTSNHSLYGPSAFEDPFGLNP